MSFNKEACLWFCAPMSGIIVIVKDINYNYIAYPNERCRFICIYIYIYKWSKTHMWLLFRALDMKVWHKVANVTHLSYVDEKTINN